MSWSARLRQARHAEIPPPVDPRDVGMRPEKLREASDLLDRLHATGKYPAIQACVRRHGRIVLHKAVGRYRPIGQPPGEQEWCEADLETRFLIFSLSKSVTAVAMHVLFDRGLVHVDDPVCWYIPEFAQHGKDYVTLRHVLTHTAGIPMIFWHLHDDLIRDWNRIVARICEQKPWHLPGRRTSYHVISGGYILGEVIRRVTGRDIRTFLRQEILDPLGFETFDFGIPPEWYPRTARPERVDRLPPPVTTNLLSRLLDVDLVEALSVMGRPVVFESIIPAANVVGTAEEACRFFELLLEGGALGGRRVLSEAQVQRATNEQVLARVDWTLFLTPQRYSLGFMLGRRSTAFNLFGRDTGSTFGHLGFSRQLGWADRARSVSGAFLTSGVPVRPGREVLLLRRFQNAIRDACE